MLSSKEIKPQGIYVSFKVEPSKIVSKGDKKEGQIFKKYSPNKSSINRDD